MRNDIYKLVLPILNDMGYELWGCEYLSQGRHSLLRIYIDKPEGITIDDCERASRQINAMLDVEDPIKENYTLEVSSPGIPRPLFDSEQYKQYIGSTVQLKLYQAMNGHKKIQGVIESVDEQAVYIAVDEETYKILYTQISKAYLADE